LLVFVAELFFFDNMTVTAYLIALYFAFSVGTILGFFTVIKKAGPLVMDGWTKVIKEVIRYGFITQMANLLSIGNNRLSFFFIKYFSGLSPLGIYTAGIQLTEGLKLIGSSIAVVQFSAISNTRDKDYASNLTIKLMKFSLALTTLAVMVLVILPESFYVFLFSNDFTGVKPVIIALSPGVIALAANNIFSHYFSGLGNPKINLYAKGVGFIFTLILAIILIPEFGLVGAAITASVSYISTVIYQYVVFKKQTNTPLRAWAINKNDFSDFKILVKEAFNSEHRKQKG
jgi:O-antigen/teichoic acid export membrane protein